MAGRGLTYSQTVNWLKVLLPLVALVLLSTMFLFARSVAPTSTIPFAKFELEERARDQRISTPFLTGQTTFGDDIEITAVSARPDPVNPRRSEVEDLRAEIKYADGTDLTLVARDGVVNAAQMEADLTGSVEITSSTGYRFQSEALTLNFNTGTATSEMDVRGDGPFGTFTAGAMELTIDDNDVNGRFLFTNGVKLIYTP